jgi:hypothetical protein
MLARYAVPPSPSPASGPQMLLLYKLRCPINHAESTLLQVFILNNLKPIGINTYEKQGEGSSLWLTNCSKRVSDRRFAGIPAFHLLYPFPSSVCYNSFICHSYENTGVAVVFFPFRNSSIGYALQPFSLLSPFCERTWTKGHGVVYRTYVAESIGGASPLRGAS